jgi:glycosyltransferase involved in cell wall biosynthesis
MIRKPMRVLMIAPQPFFSPRGTPFSVLNRCRALAALGHHVDLVTYHLGEDVAVPNLRILRAPKIPGISSVKIGPSAAKLPLDAAVFARTLIELTRRRYDVIHTHEEAGVFGWWLHRLARAPHLYDMHSDLAQQLTNFGFSDRHPLVRFAGVVERRVLRSARATIVICSDLEHRAAAYAPGLDPVLIENAPLDPPLQPGAADAWRRRWLPGDDPLVLYAGTLEPYQGVPLLLEAAAKVDPVDGRNPRLAIVGGRPDQVETLRVHTESLGIAERVHFLGQRPHAEMPACFAAADVLVSPRSSGTNTPLKIYSYLRSGRPIVATRLYTHTQVLDDDISILVEPTAEGLASGIMRALTDTGLAARLSEAARRRAEDRYSTEAFLRLTAAAYARVGAPPLSEPGLAAAVSALQDGN